MDQRSFLSCLILMSMSTHYIGYGFEALVHIESVLFAIFHFLTVKLSQIKLSIDAYLARFRIERYFSLWCTMFYDSAFFNLPSNQLLSFMNCYCQSYQSLVFKRVSNLLLCTQPICIRL